MKEFYNKGVGKCVILKEDKISDYILIYAMFANQFILAYQLDKSTGTWINGHYYGEHLEEALKDYNKELYERKEELERSSK